jgi:hypothetical protein
VREVLVLRNGTLLRDIDMVYFLLHVDFRCTWGQNFSYFETLPRSTPQLPPLAIVIMVMCACVCVHMCVRVCVCARAVCGCIEVGCVSL